MKQKTLAIFSPNKSTYSETFIQSLKKLPFQIKYYYGGYMPTQLEDAPSLLRLSVTERIKKKISKQFSLHEYGLLYSLKREKVSCVLALYGPTASESLKILKALNLPLVVQFYGFDATEFEILKQYEIQYRQVFEYAKAVIVVSRKMFEQLEALGCPTNKLHLIVCAGNPLFFNITAALESNQFIALGRFVDKKAPYLTLAAFKKVMEIYPDAKLIMGGDGKLLNTCINLAKLWNMQKNVEFKGNMKREEVMEYCASSLAFVQHSVVALNGDSEGTPVAILEAMAAGLPIIATNHAGIPDVVIDNETGLLSEEMDIDAMANNMISVLKNKPFAKRLGCNAKKHAQENFTTDKYLNQVANVINIF